MKTLQQGTTWRHRGDRLNHTVLSVSRDTVTTWSEPTPEPVFATQTYMDKGAAGYSWLGDVPTFLNQFDFVSNPNPKNKS